MMRKTVKRVLLAPIRLLRRLGKNVLLLILAGLLIGSGFYFSAEPGWTKKTYPDYYNQGVSAYLTEYGKDEAFSQFSYVASGAEDLELKSLAFYNAGTMLGELVFNEKLPPQDRLQIAQYAIENLKEAIRNDPGNEDAKYNLELLRNKQLELLMQILEEQEGEGEPAPGPDYSPGEEGEGY